MFKFNKNSRISGIIGDIDFDNLTNVLKYYFKNDDRSKKLLTNYETYQKLYDEIADNDVVYLSIDIDKHLSGLLEKGQPKIHHLLEKMLDLIMEKQKDCVFVVCWDCKSTLFRKYQTNYLDELIYIGNDGENLVKSRWEITSHELPL